MYNKTNTPSTRMPLIRPVGPEVIRMHNRFVEAEEVGDHEIMVSIATRVHNNPSFSASMRINYPTVFQKLQEIYDLAVAPKMKDSNDE